MPGVLGVVDGDAPVATVRQLAQAMAARLRVHARLRVELDRHGPGPAVLGRVDLGFLDPSEAPVVSADGLCRLVLAGEVRGQPAGARGLLEDYLARGVAALRGLSGSFVLALWDGCARRLHLANDRFGLRNLYYATDGRRLVFAPQVRALLADARISRSVDPQAVAEFLTFQCVLLDRTLLADVRLLPPASLLSFEPGGAGMRLERTFELRYGPPPDGAAEHDHATRLAEALRAACARQSRGDRPIGLPLSGGLDSRALLAALPREAHPIATITYGRPGCDDREIAAHLAALAGTRHHTISLAAGYVAAEAGTMVALTDGMHSCLNAHAALLRGAAEVCDLILLGNGGDCLLDGLWDGPHDASLDQLVARLGAKLAIGLPPARAAEVVARAAPFAGVAERALAGLRAALEVSPGEHPADRADAFNVIHRHRRWVLQGVPAQATHVEFRHPYYDDAVVEVACAVPAALRAGRRAHIAALRILSPALTRVRRQGKRFGFAAPAWRLAVDRAAVRLRDAVRWRAIRAGVHPFLGRRDPRPFCDYGDELRHGSRSLLSDVLLSPAALERGWWRPEGMRRLVEEHLAGRANHAPALGVLLTVELFIRDVLEAGRAARVRSPREPGRGLPSSAA